MEKFNLENLPFELDLHLILCRIREEDPVYWCSELGCWFITRYDDIVAAFRNGKRFSAGRKTIAENKAKAQFPGG